MNKELIEQIRNGKALHYDIDNVELLNDYKSAQDYYNQNYKNE